MPRIFLSYRRDDTRQAAGRLYDALGERFGPDAVFKDVHSIQLGATWRETIHESVSSADVTLVLIGPGWDPARLFEPSDVLAEELRAAHESDGHVIPILVDGAGVPTAEVLPESLRWLPELEMAPLRDEDFGYDLENLLGALRDRLGIRPPRRIPWRGVGVVLAAATVTTVVVLKAGDQTPDRPTACEVPANAVFVEAGVAPLFVQVTFSQWLTGPATATSDASAAESAASVARNRELSEYVRCNAIVRDSFSDTQLAYLEDLQEILREQGADAAIARRRESPFPGPLPPTLADIVVAEFDAGATDPSVGVAARIEQDLRSRLDEYDLENVSVGVIPALTTEGAEALADQGLNRVVIRGWRDDFDINVEIVIGPNVAAEAGDLTLELPDASDRESYRLVVGETLPTNTSFLSLFLVGQLKYQAGSYTEGYRAFNGAMDAMPEAAVWDRPGLQRFFETRRHEVAGDRPVDDLVCGYTEAIRADTTLYPAYNNLATVLTQSANLAEPYPWGPRLAVPPRGVECLADAGLVDRSRPEYTYGLTRGGLSPRLAAELIERVEDGMGPMPILDYNRIALYWNTDFKIEGPGYLPPDTLEARLERVIAADPSIPGAHLLLGVLRFDADRFEDATASFRRYLDARPLDDFAWFNLGQTRLAAGDVSGGTRILQDLLQRKPGHAEAVMALAGVSLRGGDPSEAWRLLSLPSGPDTIRHDFTRDRRALEAIALADLGRWDEALARIRDESSSIVLAASLIERMEGMEAAGPVWKELERFELFASSGSEVGALLDNALDGECRLWELRRAPEEWWIEGRGCLPQGADARWSLFRRRFLEGLPNRLFYRDVAIVYGMACPFVYTRDTVLPIRTLDTTILFGLDAASKKSTQSRPLQRFDGTVLIRELEAETTYLDALHVEAVLADGTVVRLSPALASLRSVDLEREVLDFGDQLLVTFPDFDPQMAYASFTIVANGHYAPLLY